VILIESQPIFASLAGVFLSKVKRAPYVLNVSDLWPDHLLSVGALSESHIVYRIARRVVNAAYRGASEIVAMSPGWAKAVQGYIGADEKIHVIYNGVDLTHFRPDQDVGAFRRKYGLGEEKLVTFIGTLPHNMILIPCLRQPITCNLGLMWSSFLSAGAVGAKSHAVCLSQRAPY
jgi:glycosyltransferase involved in cell wall biosynthesis